ncbi:MAG: hypothetical protein HWQ43_04335 [Nostoc sp. JL31]|nr:hypothetical protein [Nostoc sp. JL31]
MRGIISPIDSTALIAIALKHFDNSILRNTVLVLAIFLVLTATINSLRTQQEHI